MVLGHPDLMEPHLVQQLHLLEHPAVELRLWPVQCGDIRRQVVGSELHTRALMLEGCAIISGRECACAHLSAGHDDRRKSYNTSSYKACPAPAYEILSPALQRIGAICTRNTSCTLVAPKPSTVAPPGIKMSLKRTTAPIPWRGVGIGGKDCQRLASGSKASTCWNTPRGFWTLPSPPNTKSRSFTTAAATPDRGVGMGALAIQVRVRGSNSSRFPRVKLVLLRPATTYSRPLITPAPR